MAKKIQPTTEETVTVPETIIPPKADTLELGPIEINSFKGIDKSKPVIVDLAGHNMAVFKGGQGKRKTSTLEAIQFAFAQEFDFKLGNFVNKVDNTINIHTTFKKNNRTYVINATKTKFELLKKFTALEDPDIIQYQAQDSPKEMLRNLIGHVATSPMWLKNAKGEQQVEWVYEILKVPAEVKAKELKIQTALDKATEDRKDANKDYTKIASALSQNAFYNNWEQSEKTYKEEKKVEAVRAKWDAATKKANDFVIAENGLKNLKKNVKDREVEIAEMKLKIEQLEKEQKRDNKKIEDGNVYVQENKGAAAILQEVDKEYREVNNYIQNRNMWLNTIQLKKDMDEFQTIVVELDAIKLNLKTDLNNLAKEILPEIPGFELETEKSIDAKRPVGIYLDDKTPAQLSESELWTLYLMLIRSQGVSMIFAENLSVFGVQAIALLNEMAKDGVKIFGTLADQTLNDMAISIKDELVIKTTLE